MTMSVAVDGMNRYLQSTVQQPYFIIPFIFWLSCYIYCQIVATATTAANHNNKNPNVTERPVVPFHKWYTIHNIHNFGAIFLGTISILWADPYPIMTVSSSLPSSLRMILTNYNERIPILWSLSYFTVDIMDCFIRRDFVYSIHAICCLILGYMNDTIPVLQTLKMNSKATYCELSNPFMHLAKRTRRAQHFILFAIVFTLCRIVWIPIMYYQLISYDNEERHPRIVWYHPISGLLIAFYILNWYWYVKIVHILVTGGGNAGRQNRDDAKKDS